MVDVLSGPCHLAVAARGSGHVEDDRSRAHELDHLAGYQERGGPAGDLCSGDDDIGVGHARRKGRLLAALGLVGDLFCIAGRSSRRLVDGGRYELGAEALDLFPNLGPDVIGRDNGAEALGRGDGLEPGDTGTEDQHLDRRDGARGGCEHRKDPWSSGGG